MVWQDDTAGNHEIFYRKSTDGGDTWSPPRRLTWTSGDSSFPAVAADSDNSIHVVWEDSTPGPAEVYYRSSTDGGDTWGMVRRLTWTAGNSYEPAIAVDLVHAVHVVWYDGSPNDDIFYRKSTDKGSTWGGTERLTWSPGWSEFPALAIDLRNTVYIVWDDDRSGSEEIYYKKGTNCLSCHD
jgi:hypothetical protein